MMHTYDSARQNAAGMPTLDLLLALSDVFDQIQRNSRLPWIDRRWHKANLLALRAEYRAISDELVWRERQDVWRDLSH